MLNDSVDSAEETGRARSKSRIFSPKTTADMVSKSQSSSSAAGDDRGEEDKMDEEGISPPPRTARR